MMVHTLEAETAYAETQTSDAIKDGDVLAIPEIGLYGVMMRAWPVAVVGWTGDTGFHTLAHGAMWETVEDGRYYESASKAVELASPAGTWEPIE
jgi:hypothetical protein